jgi:hypothetical protein
MSTAVPEHIYGTPNNFFPAFAGKSRAGQLEITGRLTAGSSLYAAIVSSVV